MLHIALTLGDWAPTLIERLFKVYFSPIFRGIASYVLHQLIGVWAAM